MPAKRFPPLEVILSHPKSATILPRMRTLTTVGNVGHWLAVRQKAIDIDDSFGLTTYGRLSAVTHRQVRHFISTSAPSAGGWLAVTRYLYDRSSELVHLAGVRRH